MTTAWTQIMSIIREETMSGYLICSCNLWIFINDRSNSCFVFHIWSSQMAFLHLCFLCMSKASLTDCSKFNDFPILWNIIQYFLIQLLFVLVYVGRGVALVLQQVKFSQLAFWKFNQRTITQIQNVASCRSRYSFYLTLT
jgi:hypothetical protein